jgi:hypothetical protein
MSQRALTAVLSISALYDWTAFGLLTVMPPWLLALFDHPVPRDPFLFRLAALPLLLLPLVYLAAARWGVACPPLVRLAVLLRVVGALGIAVLTVTHRPDGAAAYWFFVLGDLGWAGLYWLLGPGRRAPTPRPTP